MSPVSTFTTRKIKRARFRIRIVSIKTFTRFFGFKMRNRSFFPEKFPIFVTQGLSYQLDTGKITGRHELAPSKRVLFKTDRRMTASYLSVILPLGRLPIHLAS